jgi:hypothetical protein
MTLPHRIALMALGISLLGSGAGPERAPVLVELFTSEGCSSCPPADRLLEALDPTAIVLSEHVDYWDRLGWRDPFSSHASTLRQEAYAYRFGTEGPYTPEMVVDGAAEFVGSDARRAGAEIARAARRSVVVVRISRDGRSLRVETGAVDRTTDVMLAIADDRDASQVLRGENRGRNLRHVSVLREMRKLATLPKGAAFSRDVSPGRDVSGKRLVIFLQESKLGRVSGAGLLVP